MARIGPAPDTHFALPADFAAALGQCVASFGWLEEIIKRTIFALDKARLPDDLTQRELHNWLSRMGHMAEDSMGALIEQLDSAMRRHPDLRDRDQIIRRLNEIRQHRNLLCHASWRPTKDPARWHPAFVSTKGQIFDRDLALPELDAIHQATIEIGTRIRLVMRATGELGFWAGDDES